MLLISVLSSLILLSNNSKNECLSRCSPHITLPCSFPSLDPCMQRTCKQLCNEDNGRPMIGCFCRGSLEGRGMRTCFCGPTKNNNSTTIKF
ncbi:hypothetical protein RB195_010731 [Necator americanus]|uniref:Trypsin Inhibitor like cysteine rich domain protein n=1 Tax=Necator americanus TaxID=51031 RepID=A0ABR1D2G8_NECAM